MKPQTAVVLGASGFIGGFLVQQLIADEAFETVRLLVRRPMPEPHAKVKVLVTDFSDHEAFRQELGAGDTIFCCIGTTMKHVNGDKLAYRKIDFDIAVNAAKLGKEAGFSNYVLVTAVGANAQSKNFYLRLKGEIEAAIAGWNFSSVAIFRPSSLMGERKEFRLLEWLSKGVMKVATNFLAGSLRKYKGIHGRTVAAAMIAAAKNPEPGTHVYEYDEMVRLAGEV